MKWGAKRSRGIDRKPLHLVSDSGGFTLLEVTITAGIMAIALVAVISGLLSSIRLRQMNAEKARARNAAECVLSAMRGLPRITDAYSRFGGGGPEEVFDVHGLAAETAGVPVGRVIVWRRKDGNPPDPSSLLGWAPGELQEARTSFGMAFPLTIVGNEGPGAVDYLDTNTDGAVNGLDDPNLIPVTVRIRWRSRSSVITEFHSSWIGVR